MTGKRKLADKICPTCGKSFRPLYWRSRFCSHPCRSTKHGMVGTRTYRIWIGITKRITNPNEPTWKRYGGRGIDMDPRWRQFKNFYADMGECPEGLSIDRIDNMRGYWAANCRWATLLEQNNNRRTSRLLTIDGKTDTLANWARISGVHYSCLMGRVKRHWPENKILSLTSHDHGPNVKPYLNRRLITIAGNTKSLTTWAKEIGLTPSSLFRRISHGVSEENLLAPPRKWTRHVALWKEDSNG